MKILSLKLGTVIAVLSMLVKALEWAYYEDLPARFRRYMKKEPGDPRPRKPSDVVETDRYQIIESNHGRDKSKLH